MLLASALVVLAQRAAAHAPVAGPAVPGRIEPGTMDAQRFFGDLPLLTQHGQPVRLFTDLLDQRVVLMNFVYTHCKEACPTIVHQLTLVRDELGAAFGRDLNFLSISVDPRRDTPAALLAFARQHAAENKGWTFVTGEPATVEGLLRKMHPPRKGLEDHQTLLFAVNFRSGHKLRLPPNLPPQVMARQLLELAAKG